MMERQNAIVFASGEKNGGGSGFEKLVEYANPEWRVAGYYVCAVASNHADGGVHERAQRLGIPFIHFPAPWTAERYQEIVRISGASWTLLSGWKKFVRGLDPARTINIHPALLSFQNGRFGGHNFHGHRVHEAVEQALRNGELGLEPESGFTMHFVTEGDGTPEGGYDKGPIFAEMKIPLSPGMSADEIGAAVNGLEHRWQPRITDMVISGLVRYKNGKVIVSPGYALLPT